MNKILLTSGIIGLIVIGLIGFASKDIWLIYFLSLGFIGIYLILWERLVISKIAEQGKKLVIRGLLAALFIVQVGAGIHFSNRAEYQDELLAQINQTIKDGIAQTYLESELLKVYREYHTVDSGLSLQETFKVHFGDALKADNRIVPENMAADDRVQYKVDFENDNTIIVLAKTPKITRYSDKTTEGDLITYAKATLTQNGVDYENVR